MRLSGKLRHALVNQWLATSALCLLFSLGIDKVDLAPICLGISVALHYLTLSALLWLVLVIR